MYRSPFPQEKHLRFFLRGGGLHKLSVTHSLPKLISGAPPPVERKFVGAKFLPQWLSLHGRCLKRKGMGVLGARETRGPGRARREARKRRPGDHCFRHPAY